MNSTEQKIHEIHEILVRQESRYKRKLLFTWIFRIILLTITFWVISHPQVVFQKVFDAIMPLVQEHIDRAVESQKEKLINSGQNIIDTLKNKSQK